MTSLVESLINYDSFLPSDLPRNIYYRTIQLEFSGGHNPTTFSGSIGVQVRVADFYFHTHPERGCTTCTPLHLARSLPSHFAPYMGKILCNQNEQLNISQEILGNDYC
jgi:hypothetical protein